MLPVFARQHSQAMRLACGLLQLCPRSERGFLFRGQVRTARPLFVVKTCLPLVETKSLRRLERSLEDSSVRVTYTPRAIATRMHDLDVSTVCGGLC